MTRRDYNDGLKKVELLRQRGRELRAEADRSDSEARGLADYLRQFRYSQLEDDSALAAASVLPRQQEDNPC